jgi:hypothetical protein
VLIRCCADVFVCDGYPVAALVYLSRGRCLVTDLHTTVCVRAFFLNASIVRQVRTCRSIRGVKQNSTLLKSPLKKQVTLKTNDSKYFVKKYFEGKRNVQLEV